jgi:hypothetical protein
MTIFLFLLTFYSTVSRLLKSNMVSGKGVYLVCPVLLSCDVRAIIDVVVECVLGMLLLSDVALHLSVLGVLFVLELGVSMLSCLLSIFRTLSRHIFSVRPWASLCTRLPGPCGFFGWYPSHFLPWLHSLWPFRPKPSTILPPTFLILSKLLAHFSLSWMIR